MTLMSVVPHFYLSVHIKDFFKINKFFVFFFATRPTEVNSSQHSKIRKFFIELAIKCAIGTRLFPSRLIILGPHIGKWRPKLQLSYFPTYSLSQCLRIAVKKVHCARCYWDLRKCFNPHLHGRGTIWYSQLWMAFSPKVPMYENSETICIPSPKYCLYTYVFKFKKQ